MPSMVSFVFNGIASQFSASKQFQRSKGIFFFGGVTPAVVNGTLHIAAYCIVTAMRQYPFSITTFHIMSIYQTYFFCCCKFRVHRSSNGNQPEECEWAKENHPIMHHARSMKTYTRQQSAQFLFVIRILFPESRPCSFCSFRISRCVFCVLLLAFAMK